MLENLPTFLKTSAKLHVHCVHSPLISEGGGHAAELVLALLILKIGKNRTRLLHHWYLKVTNKPIMLPTALSAFQSSKFT